MSYYGRLCLEAIQARWEQGQRAGKVHPWERSEILAGDYSPIIRQLKPEFEAGQKFVLSRTRPRGALVEDQRRNVEIFYPKGSPTELFSITIRDVVRHRAGYWRVRFHVFDRRETDYFPRRKPPAWTAADEEEAEEIDEAQVVVDSGYTTNPAQASDSRASVPFEYQNVLSMQAKERWANRRNDERAEETRKRELRAMTSAIKETATIMARNGLDTSELMADLQRNLEHHRERLQSAA